MPRYIFKNKNTIGSVPGSLDFIGEQKVDESSINLLYYNSEDLTEN